MSPGDEVVCTNHNQPCLCPDVVEPRLNPLGMPKLGQHYIVAEVMQGICANCHILAPCVRLVGHKHPRWAWLACWFRPLDYDDRIEAQEISDLTPPRVYELEPV